MKTKLVYCANEQEEVDHAVTISGNGEWVFTCTKCERVLKFAEKMTPEEVKKALVDHAAANSGQITQESINKKIDQLDDL